VFEVLLYIFLLLFNALDYNILLFNYLELYPTNALCLLAIGSVYSISGILGVQILSSFINFDCELKNGVELVDLLQVVR
jgi:hypothetical protein